MHAAVAGEVAHARAARADHGLLGPLRRAPDVAQRLAHTDRVAIDPRGHDRTQETRHGVDHRFVDQPKSFGDLALPNQHGAGARQPFRDQILVFQQPPEAQRFVVVPGRGLYIVHDVERDDRAQSRDPAQLRARFTALEQSLRVLPPAERDRHVLLNGMVVAEVDGQAGGQPVVARLDAQAERSLAELDAPVGISEP